MYSEVHCVSYINFDNQYFEHMCQCILFFLNNHPISSFHLKMEPIKIINNKPVLTNMTTSVNTTITNDATNTPEHQNVTTTDMVKANSEDWLFIVYAITLVLACIISILWIFRKYILKVCYVL